MSTPCQSMDWVHDDTPYIKVALAEYNLRMPAHTKPASSFGQLPVQAQSWVLQRAAEIKLDAQG